MEEISATTLNETRSIPVIYYTIVLLITTLWVIHRRQKNSRMNKLSENIPGPPPLPFIGNGHLVIFSNPYETGLIGINLNKVYGNIFRAWMGPMLYIYVADPDGVEAILNSQVHIDKTSDYQFFEPWLGNGLLISTGQKWRNHRKIIAPTFHLNILKSFIGTFNQNSKNVVKEMKQEIGKEFDVHEYMGGVTVDMLLETAMGISRKAHNKDKSGSQYANAVLDMCDILQKRYLRFYLRSELIFRLTSLFKVQKNLLKIIHGLTNKVIKSKKEEYLKNEAKGIIPMTIDEIIAQKDEDELKPSDITSSADNVFKGYRDDLDNVDEHDVGQKKRLAFLDLLVASSLNGTHQLTDIEIKEEVDTIMFEGHDTTAAGSSFALCLLGVYQHIQDKVYEELYEIFGDTDRDATYNDTLKMKYLERVILESLRLYPPVPLIARKLNEDVYLESKGYTLPAGANVVIGIFSVHRDPKFYKNPLEFNPDNFLPENVQNRPFYSYVPFSAGPRSCVGRKYALLKLKVLISTILRNYKVTSNVTEDQYKLQGDIILKRADGFRLNIEPRKRVKPTT